MGGLGVKISIGVDGAMEILREVELDRGFFFFILKASVFFKLDV